MSAGGRSLETSTRQRRSPASWLASVASVAVFAASAFVSPPAFAENELAAMADGKFNPDLVSSECFGESSRVVLAIMLAAAMLAKLALLLPSRHCQLAVAVALALP